MPLLQDWNQPFQPMMPFGFQQPQQQMAPPPDPVQQQSLLDSIGSGALSGLGYIGGALDKPRRALWGLLGGQPREALNLVPFSDAMGLTDPNQQIHGSDVLRNMGMDVPQNPDFFSLPGLASAGLEILGDPLTYTGTGLFKGALTPLGKAAQKAGVQLPKNIAGQGGRLAGFAAASPEAAQLAQATGKSVADVAGQRLGGHLSASIPFTGLGTTFDLSGPLGALGQAASGAGSLATSLPGIGPALGRAGSAASAAGDTVGRYWNAAFDRQYMNAVKPADQELAKLIHPGMEAADFGSRYTLAPALEAMGQHAATDLHGLANLREGAQGAALASSGAHAASPMVNAYLDDVADRLIKSGRVSPEFARKNYFPHAASRPDLDVGRLDFKGPGGSWKLGDGSLVPREDLFEGISRDLMNQLVMDPAIGTTKRTLGAGQATQKVMQLTGKSLDESGKIADWLYALHPERQKIGFYGNPAFQDVLNYGRSAEGMISTTNKLQQVMAQRATLKGLSGPGEESLASLVNKLGLHEGTARNNIQSMLPAALQGKALEELHLPRDLADAIASANTSMKMPQLLDNALRGADAGLNVWKGALTQPFPGFHVRNTMGNQLTGVLKSGTDYFGGRTAMQIMLDGGTIPGISKWEGVKHLGLQGKTDAEVTKELARRAFAGDVMGAGRISKEAGADITAQQIAKSLPGLVKQEGRLPQNLAAYAKDLVPKSLGDLNPLAVRGIGGRQQSQFFASRAGENLGSKVEGADRLADWLGLIKNGHHPDVAQKLVSESQAAYKYTGFEQQVMRRLFPFYGWARSTVPYQAKEILKNPGGGTANLVKAGAKAQGEEPGFTPTQLAQGLALPLGKRDEKGVQSWLAGLGLPFEELGNLASPGKYAAGMLNPMLKYPLEQLTGRQLASGRDLREIYSSIGAVTGQPMPALEGLAYNSPISRALATARTITDPRKTAFAKALNLLTGARISDVDMPTAERFQTRDFLRDELTGLPGVRRFEDLHVRPENLPQLSPEQQQMYYLLKQLERRKAS